MKIGGIMNEIDWMESCSIRFWKIFAKPYNLQNPMEWNVFRWTNLVQRRMAIKSGLYVPENNKFIGE